MSEAAIVMNVLELAQMIFTLLQNDLLYIHKVYFQVFAKVF